MENEPEETSDVTSFDCDPLINNILECNKLIIDAKFLGLKLCEKEHEYQKINEIEVLKVCLQKIDIKPIKIVVIYL